ncbi:IclR family transcriptional regulator [Ornithinicoccus hortensis]|uniref:IclR family transcriptional regulator n=1 Tax=Ornithinicoccus hortensis TaxID=82346 RepID=A0A542YTD2_9MICO|nr:IclR family transcriptional regulator [Ornithinicoccus hortensis]TQL51338.1 IclR family transcriptional regulator [Ornithinicoccus hortensis]
MEQDKTDQGNPGIVRRATDLLAAFSAEDRSLTVAELARRAGLARSTAYRLVEQVVEVGLMERHGTRIQLGLRLYELGLQVPQQRTLRTAVSPYLHDLRDATRHTANLAVLDGADIVYVDRVPGPNAPPLPFRLGGRHVAHATAMGKAIMAHLEADELAAILPETLGAVTPRTTTDRATLTRELAKVRSNGLAIDHEETRLGVTCVGSPIFDRHGRVLAAISVTGLAGPAALGRYGPAVRMAALNATRFLQRTAIHAR